MPLMFATDGSPSSHAHVRVLLIATAHAPFTFSPESSAYLAVATPRYPSPWFSFVSHASQK